MYEEKLKEKNFKIEIEENKEEKIQSFWNDIKNFKELYSTTKKNEFLKKMENVKKEKITLNKINPELSDIISLFLFILSFSIMSLLNVKEYFAYIIIPIAGMLFGKYYLPKKIKIVDNKKIKELEYKYENDDFSKNFEEEVAGKLLIESFKTAYGKSKIEDIIVETIEVEENPNIERNQIENAENFHFEIKIKDLIKKANKIDSEEKNRELAKKMASYV